MKKKTIAALLITALATTACAQNQNTKQTVGGVSGAILGGLLGAQFGKGTGQVAAAAAGAALGGFFGSEIGRYMDEEDQRRAQNAYQTAHTAPIGRTISWNNPDSGNYGTVKPTRDGNAANGSYCREYQQTVTIDGRLEEAYGVACRDADGRWEIQ